MEWIGEIKMMVWAALIVFMPYSLFKKNCDAFAASFVLFGMLSLDVMIMVSTGKIIQIGWVPW
ncbi:MAG TPA: hypothetical protein VFC02_22570 [Anaerolineales bacterium]|nr:hypothetical protein [Anaerolineales bacterium]